MVPTPLEVAGLISGVIFFVLACILQDSSEWPESGVSIHPIFQGSG